MSDYGNTPPPPPGGGAGDAGPGGYGGAGGYNAPPPAGGGYGGGGAVDHPKGMTILILGILSLVCCSPLGIAAWLMGNTAIKEIDASPGRYSNRQIVQIGRILGIVGVVLMILSVIYLFAMGGLAAITSQQSSSM